MAAEVNKPDFSFQWASGGAIVAPSDVKIQTGWTAEVPPFQWENYLQNRQDNGLLHLFQKGISEWDAASNYYFTTSGVRSYVQGSDGLIYVAVQDSVGQDPTTDVSDTYWKVAFASLSDVYTKAQVDAKFIATKVTKITASGTYTPTAGMKAVFVQVQAGGGGGGGAQGAGSGASSGAGGSAGGYSEGYFLAAAIGASQAVTIGSGGAGGIGVNPGAAGTATSFGALLTATGGSFGNASNVSTGVSRGALPDVVGGGSGNTQNGQNGGIGMIIGLANGSIAGSGGSSRLGVGGQGRNEGSTGFSGTGYGSGGAGGAGSTVTQNGGPGAQGVIIVTEYF